MDKAKKVFLQVLIDPEIKRKLADRAEKEGKNMTDAVLELINSYIDESSRVDNTEIIRRLEAVEKFVGIEKSRLVGELSA